MSIAPHLLLKITGSARALVAERIAKEGASEIEVDRAVSEIIAKLPDLIAHVHADGGSYADVMTLLEGRDYCCSTWKDRLFSKSPAATWLNGVSAGVYAYCEEAGLQPFLAPYRGVDRRESRIVIQWASTGLDSTLCVGRDSSFLTQLYAATAAGQAKKAAERSRARVKEVKTTIAEMHRSIISRGEKGLTDVHVTTCFGSKKRATVESLSGDSWVGDIIAYCHGIGLTLSVKSEEDRDNYAFAGQCYRTELYASWEKGMKIPRAA